MRIIIPSYGRPHSQTTFESLPKDLQDITTVVVQPKDSDSYSWLPHVDVLPESIKTIGPTRQWIQEHYIGKVCVLDDDLTFAKRRTDNPTKFVDARGQDVLDLFEEIKIALDTYAQVGVATREGGNRNIGKFMYNTRMLRMLCYDNDILNRAGIRWDRIMCKVDFDVTLQLLRKGWPNVVINGWCHNQKGSNTFGGCSHFRTHEVLEQAAHDLHDLHPLFVTVVEKETKSAWGGGKRTDVRIQWKKAFMSGGQDGT